jgi:hypothetical protein
VSEPTAREREWYDYVDTADGRYVSQSEAEAEIIAAERAAVEAFLAYLGCHGDDSYSRWMRERFIEWSLREREGAK